MRISFYPAIATVLILTAPAVAGEPAANHDADPPAASKPETNKDVVTKDVATNKDVSTNKDVVTDKDVIADKEVIPNKDVVTNKDVSAADVATTPLSDLNIKKGTIPPVLTTATQQAYSLHGLGNCQRLASAIGELDAVLGPDVDVPKTGGRRISAGKAAQSFVGSFIPFRGVIRELSGASGHERELQAAILAGVARRAFLKGTGQSRGCRYPARSAPIAK